MRRVGVLVGAANNSIYGPRIAALEQVLQQLGWIEGRNVRIDVRWGGNNSELLTAYARELVQLQPDVIVTGPTNALAHLRKATDKIPIVFVQVSDPLGRGIVDSLARPTGNITGFSNLEFLLIGKYLQIVKDVAPGTARAGVMIHVSNAVSDNWFRMFNKLAPSFAVEPIVAPVRDRADIERTVASLAARPNGSLIVPGDSYVESDDIRKLIVDLTASHRVPALYTRAEFVRDGGLMSYGIDQLVQYRGAASYVDRILKGEAPSDLPVQQPTKFEFVVSLKVAKALGLTVPMTLQASADEVIE
jgi:putative ABC transport system substrate-binding protein